MTEEETRRWNTIFDILGRLEDKIDEVASKDKKTPTPPVEHMPWRSIDQWYTPPGPNDIVPDLGGGLRGWTGPVDQDTPDSVCLHKQCPHCGGAGVTPRGLSCVHAISCNCPNCSPQC